MARPREEPPWRVCLAGRSLGQSLPRSGLGLRPGQGSNPNGKPERVGAFSRSNALASGRLGGRVLGQLRFPAGMQRWNHLKVLITDEEEMRGEAARPDLPGGCGPGRGGAIAGAGLGAVGRTWVLPKRGGMGGA